MPEGKSPFAFEKKKKSQIELLITFNQNYLSERFPHPDKYSWEISYEYLSRQPEPTKFMPYYLRKYLKLHVSQTRKLSRYLLLTVNDSSQGFVFILTSIVSLQGHLQCLKSLQGAQWQVPLLFEKKGKLAKMTICCHSLSFFVTYCRHFLLLVVTRCYSLSLVVIRCHSLSLVVICCHSLSFVAICCHSLYHSLYSLSFIITRCKQCEIGKSGAFFRLYAFRF